MSHRAVICCFLLLTLLPSFALSGSAANAPSNLPLIAIADVRPWGYNDNGQPAGLLTTLTQRLLSEVDIEARVELRPYVRAIQGIADGSVDMAYLFADPNATHNAISLGIVVESFSLLTVLATPEHSNPALDDFAQRSIAYVRGTYYGEAFAESPAHKVGVEDGAQALALLQRGRVDAVVTTDQALYNALRRLNVASTDVRSVILSSNQVGHLYLSPHSPFQHLATPLRLALDQLREQGYLERLFHTPAP